MLVEPKPSWQNIQCKDVVYLEKGENLLALAVDGCRCKCVRLMGQGVLCVSSTSENCAQQRLPSHEMR